MSTIFIGTSGWNYKGWKDSFYKGVSQKKWLMFYSQNFNAVEVNATFYRSLKSSTYEKWMSITPDNFWFVIKGTREITHIKRLKKDIESSLLKQKENLAPILKKTKAILWQFPPGFKKDIKLLDNFLTLLREKWSDHTHILEFRNKTWFDQEVAHKMEEYEIIGNCISDSPKWPMWEITISNVAYIRLHGHKVLYHSKYSENELKEWAEKIKNWSKEGKEVFVFFDNTDSGAAPYDAMELKRILSLN